MIIPVYNAKKKKKTNSKMIIKNLITKLFPELGVQFYRAQVHSTVIFM